MIMGLKGAFFFGGRLGDGVMSVRRPDGAWSAPAFFAMGSGSSKGLFAGVSLEGSSIHPDNENDEQFYEHSYAAREILLEGRVAAPDAAKPFLDTLREYASGRQ